MSSRVRIVACAALASAFLLVAPAGAQQTPDATAPNAETSPCAPPEPEPTPTPTPDPDDPTPEPVDEPAPTPTPTPTPEPVERPPELAFVNGRCVPVEELQRLLAGYESSVAEEAAALVELRTQLEEVSRLSDQLDATERSVAEVSIRGAEAHAESRYAAMREAIAGEELRAVRAELDVQRTQLREQAVAAYLHGGDPRVAVHASILDTDDINAVGTGRVYSQVIVDTQVGVVELIETLEAAAEVLEAELAAARAHSDAVAEDVSGVKAAAEALRDQQATLVEAAQDAAEHQAELVSSIQDRRDEFAGQLGFQAASSGNVAIVLSDLGDGTASLADVEPFSSPLESTVLGSGFGPRLHPIFDEVRTHTGLDLSSPAGAPIFAVADGTVVVAGEEGGYGLAVAIDHGGGVATLYAHMSAFNTAVGREVAAGDIIGFVGSTGYSTGPHLHFELRLDGLPVDPLPFVDLRAVAASGAGQQADLLTDEPVQTGG